MNAAIHVADYGTDLSSRSTGRKLREILERQAADGVVVLDFAGVQSITHSFADELLAVLVAQKGADWFRTSIRVQNHKPEVRLTLLDAIHQRLNGSPLQAA